MKIYCFSDSHIITTIRSPLIEFLMEVQTVKPDYLVCSGDIFEAARVGWKELIKMDGFLEMSMWLSNIASNGKTAVVLIEGNHDFDLHKYKDSYFTNCIVARKYFEVGNYYFTHGWQEFDWTINWVDKRLYRWLFPYFPRWQWLYDKYVSRATKFSLKPESNPDRFHNELYWWFIKGCHDGAMDFAMERNQKIIFGHTHEPSIRRFPYEPYGWTVANSGDFLDSNTGLIIEDDEIKIWRTT